MSGFTTVSGTAEVNFMLFRNPVGSGKVVRIKEFLLTIGAASTQKSIFKVYSGPTITSNGTELPIYKNKSSQPNSSTMLAYQNPVTSNRGVFLAAYSVDFNTFPRDIDLSRYVEAGDSLLITVQPGTTGIEHNFSISFAEV